MRLIAVIVACTAVLAFGPTAFGAQPEAPAHWAQAQIDTVVAAGLMAPSAAEFRPDDPLTKGELAELLTGLQSSVTVAGDPALPVTVAELDGVLVRHAGLGDAAKQFRRGLVAAGLKPPKRAGTEIVAHMLGLRPNHTPESLELGPDDPATRAEAAYSVAIVLALPDGWRVGDVQTKAAAFAVPELNEWQRRILGRAVSFLGFPYVWAGSSEKPQSLSAGDAPAGFDCSGFVWRVYKLEPFADAPQLADTLKGRTTYAMSAEVPKAARIGRGAIEPADVLFFGDNGPESKAAQIGHMGIYLGNGWFIHASSGGAGVMLSTLGGWYEERFAWARRPLAEAGLGESPAPVEAPPPAEAAPADPVTAIDTQEPDQAEIQTIP
jgi:cell wall-associated NlpC family hydrolase